MKVFVLLYRFEVLDQNEHLLATFDTRAAAEARLEELLTSGPYEFNQLSIEERDAA